MVSGFVIGVDGGNTKTHYALFDTEGNLLRFLKAGTTCHERLNGGYDGLKNELEKQIEMVLSGCELHIEDIGYGVFGLAGADTKNQHLEIEKRVEEIGFANFSILNDAYLGIKAGTENGYGICSINGTGATSVGIDRYGKRFQLGGCGEITGDFAGGEYIQNAVIRLVYESIFKRGRQTIMKEMFFNILEIVDEEVFIDAVYEKVLSKKISSDLISKIAFNAANKNDEVAVELLRYAGRVTAESVIGVFKRLDFSCEREVEVVMAGSIYVKGENQILNETFKDEVSKNIDKNIRFHLLQEPPVAGAAIWALEKLNGKIDGNVRRKVLNSFNRI